MLLISLAVGLFGRFGGLWAPADIVNHVAPFWLTVAGLAAVALLLSRATRLLGLTGLAATLALATVILRPELAAPHPGASQGQLRVVQFNLFKSNSTPLAAQKWIEDQQADIVVVEEAGLGEGAVLKSLKAAYPYAVDCLGSQGRCSTVILSRVAPLASGGLADGDPENRSALSAAWARFGSPTGAFTVVGVHLIRPWPFGDQTAEVALLGRFVASQNRSSMIILGDFNQTPWTFAMRRQDAALGVPRWSRRHATWPARGVGLDGRWPFPAILPLDHVYAGSDWRVTRLQPGPVLGSDHLPLVIDLTRRGPNAEGPRPHKG